MIRLNRLLALCFVIAVTAGCEENPGVDEKKLFFMTSSDDTGITFRNEIENQKNFNIFKYRNFYNGGGVAVGDINNDGLPDIYFSANMKKNRLYLNKGNWKFEDITDQAGVGGNKPWSTGVVMADVNGDGLLDIYVSNAGNMEGNNHDNDLYINNGDLTFTEKAAEFNLAKSGFSTHASFFDYDKDGDLDAYLLNNSNIPVSSLGYAADRDKRASDWENVPEIFRGVGDVLLRNDDGKFVDVSEEAGIYGSLIGFGLGVLVCDINDDTYPDIYVTNDFYERDYLYINQKDGTFSEEIKQWTSHLCLSAMGVDIADINNDGLRDIFITDMMPENDQRTKGVMEFETYDVFKLKQSRDFYQQYIQNTLQLNNGNNSFSEIAYYGGVARTDWSWAGLILDMDNDGLKDIFVTNGIMHDLTDIDFVDFLANEIIRNMVLTGNKDEVVSIINKMPVTPLPNYAFRNNGDLTFQNASHNWGLSTPSFSNGCAYGDLDGDGDLDLVVNNVNMEAFVYRNDTRQITNNNFLQFDLKGLGGNTFAIGSTVKLFIGETILVQDLMPSRGFQSSMDYVLTFGLGSHKTVDSVSVLWPDNKISVLKAVPVNQKITLQQSEAIDVERLDRGKADYKILSEIDHNVFEPHVEDSYDDFDHEGLIIRQVSREGPALASGDVNGDGNEDIFLGGAKGQPGRIFLHSGNGRLQSTNETVFMEDAEFEDTTAAFFDADGDGDIDLVVGTGGNIAGEKATYKVRLYLNDGKGKFSKSQHELPFSRSNISVIAPSDFDQDGDFDLFVGARSIPGVYGVDPNHLLLINRGDGTFVDGTERYGYDLRKAGMVTSAKWADMDGDGKSDLVIVSDWGVPQVLKNSGRKLTKWQSDLDSISGLWSALDCHDLDQDGDVDLILGNAGSNIPYAATKERPMKLWVNDFDENGTIEQIITIDKGNRDFPIHMRKELTFQLPELKKQNLKASDYSKRTIQELFNAHVIENAIQREVNISESVIAVNEGGGEFSIVLLPPRVQWSSVRAISCADVTGDGNLDIVLGGNDFEIKPQFSRQDASYGHVLSGDGRMGFKWHDFSESGFFVRDEIRHLLFFSDQSGKTFVFVAVNSSSPRVYEVNEQQKPKI